VLKDWQGKAQDQEKLAREVEKEKAALANELATLKAQVLPGMCKPKLRSVGVGRMVAGYVQAELRGLSQQQQQVAGEEAVRRLQQQQQQH